ncbi:MAG: double-strand break repair protein AddB [Alphaproteobacteria bacterium]
MSPDRQASLYTIAAGTPFVDALAAGLVAGAKGGPLELSRRTVLLPTRRACRALGEAFLRIGDGAPMLLPAMRPLGDVDEDEAALGAGALGTEYPGDAEDVLELAPAIPPLRRQLLLARLILEFERRRGEAAPDPAQAARLAAELARLLDQVQTERLSFEALAGLVPEDYARHWQETLDFLKIVTEHWPDIVAAEGFMDPAARRNRLLEAQAARWRAAPPDAPVIAAGSTGSIPATAELLEVIAQLPEGAVVLPGLEVEMDDACWEQLEAGHPQYGMKQLLDRIGIERGEVRPWDAPGVAAGEPKRAALIAEALRPAATTEAWHRTPPPPPEALRGLARVDAPGPQEEAGVIALALRRALERPGQRAALVTPDRGLARRVAAELARWDIEIDDSGGVPLAETPPGAFLRLCAEMLAEALAPVALLAALKHPFAAGGIDAASFRARARELERLVLRGPRPAPGVSGLRRALKVARAPRELIRWFATLAKAATPFARLLARKRVPLAVLLEHHLGFAEWLAADHGGDGAERLWAGEAGEATAAFVAELSEAARGLPPIAGAAYPALFASLMGGRVVRPRHGRHPRLNIWGLLEARLQHAEVLVLGGLNEGTWPAEPVADPWLSRPMRARFGLPAPERRIGLAAHDFAQAVAAPRVLLTRAAKVEGTPTVPSRWLLRLDNLLKAPGAAWPGAEGTELLHWQGLLDRPVAIRPGQAPEPRPPLAARPRQLSVTRVEIWMRDPYALYARHVLGLEALERLDADPGAAERGTFIHQALDRFLRACPEALPEDAYERLLELGREAFGSALDRPGVRALWWPRFGRVARWFIAEEARRRKVARTLATEVKGKLVLPGPAGDFTLTAKADRIDRMAGGGLAIIDYKTGAVPPKSELESGYAPQLPLEAAIAEAGGFEGVPAAAVDELGFWRLSGGEPPGEVKTVKVDPRASAATARQGLERLIAAFDDPDTPYRARPRPEAALRYNDYEHLARLKEWSSGAAEESG